MGAAGAKPANHDLSEGGHQSQARASGKNRKGIRAYKQRPAGTKKPQKLPGHVNVGAWRAWAKTADDGKSFRNAKLSSKSFDSRVGASAAPKFPVDFGSRPGTGQQQWPLPGRVDRHPPGQH